MEPLTLLALYTLIVLAAGYVLGKPIPPPRNKGTNITPGPEKDPEPPADGTKPKYEPTTISKGKPENGT